MCQQGRKDVPFDLQMDLMQYDGVLDQLDANMDKARENVDIYIDMNVEKAHEDPEKSGQGVRGVGTQQVELRRAIPTEGW